MAGLATGIVSGPDALQRDWVRLAMQLQPNVDLRPVYDAYYQVYRDLYESAKRRSTRWLSSALGSVPEIPSRHIRRQIVTSPSERIASSEWPAARNGAMMSRCGSERSRR